MIVNESLIVGNGKYLLLEDIRYSVFCTLVFILSLCVYLIDLLPDLQKCNAN